MSPERIVEEPVARDSNPALLVVARPRGVLLIGAAIYLFGNNGDNKDGNNNPQPPGDPAGRRQRRRSDHRAQQCAEPGAGAQLDA